MCLTFPQTFESVMNSYDRISILEYLQVKIDILDLDDKLGGRKLRYRI